MEHVGECTKETIRRLMSAVEKAALGKSIAFVFEEGTHRLVDEGKTFSMPNGTITFRLFINGGAKDSGVAASSQAEPVHPSIAADVGET